PREVRARRARAGRRGRPPRSRRVDRALDDAAAGEAARARRAAPRAPAGPRRGGATVSGVGRALVVAATLLLALAGAAAWPLLSLGAGWLDVRWQHPWLALGLLVVPLLIWAGTLGQDA